MIKLTVAEFWVMRVVCRVPGDDLAPEMFAPEMAAVAARVASGKYQVINGEVCEPIECYADADPERAQRKAVDRAQREHARTGCVHKVVLSADL